MDIKGLYVKRGWYYYRGPQRGGVRPPSVALKTQDLGEAVDEVFKLHTQGLLDTPAGPQMRMSVALSEWLEDAKREGVHRPKTSSVTKSCMEDLVNIWGDPQLSWISRDKILDWRALLLARPGRGGNTMSESSVASYLRRLQGFLSWCVRRRYLRKSPMEGMKLPVVRVTKRQAFCTIQQREVLLAADCSEEIRFILFFGFFAGLRFGEMVAMKREWISESGGEGQVLTIQSTNYFKPKSIARRTIPLHGRLIEFLDGYGRRSPFMLAADRPNWVELPGYRYNPKKSFKRFVTKLDMPWVSYHTLRHSFATHLAMAGAASIEIASVLGDTLEVTERNYIGFAPGSDRTIAML